MKWRLALLLQRTGPNVDRLISSANSTEPVYHHFADRRDLLGSPHCADVVWNILFLIAGPSEFASFRTNR